MNITQQNIVRIVNRTLYLFGLGLILAAAAKIDAGETVAVKIGMAKSFMHERPKSIVDIAAGEFKDVLKKATGLDGDMVSKFSAAEIVEKLQNKQLDFGVLYGHEFAWAQKKYPDLQALLVAANKQQSARAYLIVNKKTPIKSIADLKGKKLEMPMGTSEPARLFIAKLCSAKNPTELESYFVVINSSSASGALDDLARQKADAVLVDSHGLEFYKEVKGPVFENNLKILQESERFPAVVIICKKGGVNAAVAKQFCDGLRMVHTVPLGREMMKSWNIDGFEPIPKDYAKSIADVLKAYPAPTAAN